MSLLENLMKPLRDKYPAMKPNIPRTIYVFRDGTTWDDYGTGEAPPLPYWFYSGDIIVIMVVRPKQPVKPVCAYCKEHHAHEELESVQLCHTCAQNMDKGIGWLSPCENGLQINWPAWEAANPLPEAPLSCDTCKQPTRTLVNGICTSCYKNGRTHHHMPYSKLYRCICCAKYPDMDTPRCANCFPVNHLNIS